MTLNQVVGRSTVRSVVDSLRMLSDLLRIRCTDGRGLYADGEAHGQPPRPDEHG